MECPECKQDILLEDEFDPTIGHCENCGSSFKGTMKKRTQNGD